MSPATKSVVSKFSQAGQGILEIIVVVSITSILITSLIVLAVRANRNADFSRAEDQAARLAQEGLEIIRSLRQAPAFTPDTITYATGCNIVEGAGSSRNWDGIFAENIAETDVTCTDPRGKNAYLLAQGDPNCTSSPTWCLHFLRPTSTTTAETIDLGNGRIFLRTIYVADTPGPLPAGKSNCNISNADFNLIKQFTVLVSWSDTIGTHEQVVSSCITRDGHET